MSGPGSHSKIGPSARHRWMVCPGSVALAEQMPPSPSSEASIEGTRAHAVAEAKVKIAFGLKMVADDLSPFMADTTTPEMIKHADEYVNNLKQLIGDEKAYTRIEQRFQFDAAPELFGTTDAVIYLFDSKTLIIIDYKFGFSPVDVGTKGNPNPQLEAYAIMAVEDAVRAGYQVERVILAIHQPRVPVGSPWNTLVLDAVYLMEERRPLLIEQCRAAMQPNAKLEVGEHCKYCPGKAICPERVKSIATAFVRPASTLDDYELLSAYAGLKIVEDFIDEVKARALEAAQRGDKGFSLAKRKAARQWLSKEAAAKFIMDVKPELLNAPTPAQSLKAGLDVPESMLSAQGYTEMVKLSKDVDKDAEAEKIVNYFKELSK